jgi:hypothetical protein
VNSGSSSSSNSQKDQGSSQEKLTTDDSDIDAIGNKVIEKAVDEEKVLVYLILKKKYIINIFSSFYRKMKMATP